MKYVIVIGTPWRSGGNFVLHFITKALNSLGEEAVVTMIDKPAEEFWSKEYPDTKLISENEINRDDVLIVPEEFIFMIAHLASKTTKYAIINQGFFASFNSNFGTKNNYFTNLQIYKNAIAVLCNSEHTRTNVSKWFEVPEEKIINYVVHIEPFFTPGEKTNKITYMSRKNFQFCKFIISYLEGRYQDWEFEDISNVSNEEVARKMSTSRIFLAFSGPEGLGMPPIEAALCGNKVIGFHGYGGMEYFKEPIFTEVPYGNHYAFLLKTTEQLPVWKDRNIMDDVVSNMQVNELRHHYSEKNARNSLRELIRRVNG